MLGLLLGSVIGTALAVLAAASRPALLLLEPFMTALNAVPRIVLAPLLIIWFGIGIASKVALAVLLVAVLMFFAVFTDRAERPPSDRPRPHPRLRPRLLLTEVYILDHHGDAVQPSRSAGLHRGDRRGVRRIQPRAWVFAEFRAVEFQCGADARAGFADHGVRCCCCLGIAGRIERRRYAAVMGRRGGLNTAPGFVVAGLSSRRTSSGGRIITAR